MLSSRRTDARRNREAILRTADEAFAEDVDLVPLSEIARRSGLGRATVYRHFSDRYALGLAVAESKLHLLRELVADTDDADFLEVLAELFEEQISRRPLVRLFRELSAADQRRYADQLVAVLSPGLRRAQRAGAVRADVTPADLALICEMVEGALSSHLPTGGVDSVERVVQTLLTGLRTTSGPAAE
ncbi:TetR/AcrR family transcriptional regulator [Saccharopolyspora mangrovi]|uniref:TetR/AcrR family transcriptional regulator n=1 Tax=Saccharopolyspora mangrovi TaxID=3082379 RepID=A0ABU6AFK1_9PSEU|nr:TetR/AcrR family transcriptional regulator [Saccharopolyspora sp. S2-29]MEB3370344.1 TetR/AcrR family transcriptional regulator [Saccharopolyspora sp. S2-29]